jgi:hypothetical protein
MPALSVVPSEFCDDAVALYLGSQALLHNRRRLKMRLEQKRGSRQRWPRLKLTVSLRQSDRLGGGGSVTHRVRRNRRPGE